MVHGPIRRIRWPVCCDCQSLSCVIELCVGRTADASSPLIRSRLTKSSLVAGPGETRRKMLQVIDGRALIPFDVVFQHCGDLIDHP